MKLKLIADSVKVAGPRIDGSYSVTFSAGEHQAVNVAKLLAIPKNSLINLDIEIEQKNEGYKDQAET